MSYTPLLAAFRATAYYISGTDAIITIQRAAFQAAATWIGASTENIALPIPSTAGKGKYYVVAVRDSDGVLTTITGSEFTYAGADVTQVPLVTAGYTALYYALTYTGMMIFNDTMVTDVRVDSVPAAGGTGDVTGPAGATADNLVSYNGATGKIIKDSGITSASVSSAVSASHARQHAITSTLDHTSAATSGQMLKADANGLPVNATNTDAQVAAAVTASHAAVTISDTSTVDLSLTGQALSAAVIPGGIKLDDLGTPDDNTDLNATTTYHGLLSKLSGIATQYQGGDGLWHDLPLAMNLFLSDTASDIGGYKALTTARPTAVTASVAVSCAAADTLIYAFAMTANAFNLISAQVVPIHIHAAKTAGTKTVFIYAKLFNRAAGGAETLLGTSENSVVLTGANTPYDLSITVADSPFLSTDRLVVKFYGTPGGAGTAPTATIYYQSPEDSRVELGVQAITVTPALHALDDSTVHSIGSLTNTYLIKSDGTKLAPATNTDAQVSAAVTASHAAVTISDTTSIDLSLTGQALSADLKALTGDVTTVAGGVATTLANKQTVTISAPLSSTQTISVIAAAAPTLSISAATTLAAGSMSAADKTKLDGIASGATANAKATGAELDTGTDDVKFATAKALKDSHNVPSVIPGTSGNLLTSNGTDWTSAAPPANITGNAATVTVADAGGDTTTWPLLGTSQTGSLSPATDAGLTYNATTNALTATTFIGALNGNADTVTVVDAAADTTTFPLLGTSATGSLAPATDAGLTYNASTDLLTSGNISSTSDASILAHTVRADNIQKQTVLAYTTAGTSTAFTLTTFATALALTTNECWHVIFNATAGATPTLNRDSKGAKALKYYDNTGAKQACSATTIISGMRSQVVYDGTDYVVLDTLPSTNIAGNAATVTVADAGADTTTWPLLGTSQTGSLAPATDAGLTYNASTNALTTTTFVGALTGNADTVTTNANLTGDVTSVGNATTIGAGKVTNAMHANMAANTVKVNATAGAAVPTDLAINASSLVGRAAAGNIANITLGTGVEFNSTAIQRSALTGDATASAGNNAVTVVSASTTWSLTGEIRPTAITGTVNDWAPTSLSTANVIAISLSGNATLNGLTGGASGREILLINTSAANTIYLAHDNAGSTAANRFYCPNSADFYIGLLGSVKIKYDSTLARWMVLGTQKQGTATPQNVEGPGKGSVGSAANGLAYNDHVHAYDYWFQMGSSLQNNTVAAGTTVYIAPFTSGAPGATQYSYVAADGINMKRLVCLLNSAQPGTGSLVVILRTNAATDSITLTIPAGSVAGAYSETSTGVSLSTGGTVRYKITNNASGASGQIVGISNGYVNAITV